MVGDPPSHSYYCGDGGSGSGGGIVRGGSGGGIVRGGGGAADATRHLRSAAELRTAQHR